jgi:ketosteroid isomerase-like protein
MTPRSRVDEARHLPIAVAGALILVLWPAATGAETGAERAVARAEQQWTDAIARKDLAAIDRLVADDFVGTMANGARLTKAVHLAQIRTGIYDVESVKLDDVTVRVLGNTAIVTYAQVEKSQYFGRDNSGRYLYTDVFAKRRKGWQLVAEHACRP